MKYKVEVNQDGTFWKFNGKLHREDGPAVTWADGTQIWYKHGTIHREDGPAIVYADGSQCWYLRGFRFTESQWKDKVAQLNQSSCAGKIVEIEGKKYKLTEV